MKVIVSPRAEKDIIINVDYIAKKSNPHNAYKLNIRFWAFIPSLGIMPEKYGFCRYSRFAKKQYRCATFEQSYIFVYAIHTDKVLLLRVIHGLKLN
jgi:plasmid stabilization system protein ParE